LKKKARLEMILKIVAVFVLKTSKFSLNLSYHAVMYFTWLASIHMKNIIKPHAVQYAGEEIIKRK
jgi:hypothetical protein